LLAVRSRNVEMVPPPARRNVGALLNLALDQAIGKAREAG